MVITLLLSCIFLILLCHYLIHHGRFWQLIDQIPGPPPLLIIGNALLWCTCSVEEQLKILEKYLKIYHPVAKVWTFNIAGVLASHPDDVQTILSNSKQHIGKRYAYTFLYPWLGTGLLTSEGTKWHERRKMLTPAFHFNMLKQFVDIFIEEGNYMTQCLKDIEGSTVNDLIFFTSHYTLNVICETAMGISLKDMGEFQQQYRKAVHEITKLIMARGTNPLFYPNVIFAFSSLCRRQAKVLKILHGFTEKLASHQLGRDTGELVGATHEIIINGCASATDSPQYWGDWGCGLALIFLDRL
nr:PREDICTED: cytochrome P450 4C1-like [Linepithema humile]